MVVCVCVCALGGVHMCHSTYKETRKQFSGVGSLLPQWNPRPDSGHHPCVAGAFTD